MHVIMIRHGSTDNDTLTSTWISQIQKAWNDLWRYGLNNSNSLLITSPSGRTRETAEIIQDILKLSESTIETTLTCGYITDNPQLELAGFQASEGYSRLNMMMRSRLEKILEKYNLLLWDKKLIICTHTEYFDGFLWENVRMGEIREFSYIPSIRN